MTAIEAHQQNTVQYVEHLIRKHKGKGKPRMKKRSLFVCMECGKAVKGRRCRCGSTDIDVRD